MLFVIGWSLQGDCLPGKKKLFINLWEKCSKQNMYYEVLNIVCFLPFFVKCKENDLHGKYTFLGGHAENASSTISQIEQNWWFYFIYKG